MTFVEYSAVIRGNTVIAAYGDLSGISEREILRLVPPLSTRVDQKITASKLLSFVTTPGLVFVAVSHQQVDKQRPIAFLNTLSHRWVAACGKASASAADHALDHVFASNFAGLFDEYAKVTKTSALSHELDETQQILAESMTKALDRRADLEGLSSKSENLMSTSEEFRTQATNLKWKMRCQYIKSWFWWILTILLIVYLLLSFVCGGFRLKRCF